MDSDDIDSDVNAVRYRGHKDDLMPDVDANKAIPQDAQNSHEFLEGMNPRLKSWLIRFILTVVMIGTFVGVIYSGPLALVLLISAIQVKGFHEIITIGYTVYHSYRLPWFRMLSWFFLITSNYYIYGESLIEVFGVLLAKQDFLWPLVRYHKFISFCLYVTGLVWFVLSLRKKYYIKQFTLFGWTHVTLLLLVTSAHMSVQNLFEGMIWFLVPSAMIIINDIMAYMFGFFFGRTPLIKLSPKKTWEGFIGGAFSTIIMGMLLSSYLMKFEYLICPINFNDEAGTLIYECEPPPVFQLKAYQLPGLFNKLWTAIGLEPIIHVYPFILHSISIALFASTIGPFGGFFASGFKRAFKIKDFGDLIPGHGGIIDRMDCQLIMSIFTFVYYSSFVKGYNPNKLFQQILTLSAGQQIEIFQKLEKQLQVAGYLP